MNDHETELVKRAKSGDTQAFTELLSLHGADVLRFTESKLPDRYRSVLSAEDVLQQSYTDALRDLHRFEHRGEGSFAAWLRKIASNNLGDAIRMLDAKKRGGGRQKIEVQNSDQSLSMLYGELALSGATPSRHVAMNEAQEFLKKAIEGLPEDHRKVITLFDLEGQSAESISKTMGRSIGAIYMLRARAHDLLRDLLGRESRFFSNPG